MRPILLAPWALVVCRVPPPTAASHWSHSAGLLLSWTLEAPARFNFPLTNTAGGPLDVSSVDIHFSCQSPDEPYIVKVDDGTSAGIPAGVSHDFPGVIAMNVSS